MTPSKCTNCANFGRWMFRPSLPFHRLRSLPILRLRRWLVCGSMLAISLAPMARAQPVDPPPTSGVSSSAAPSPTPTVKRVYSLQEALRAVEQNHPNLWAARAKLAFVHAQLDEAKWLPYWDVNARSTFGVLPPITGTPFYSTSTAQNLTTQLSAGVQPFFRFDIGANLPIFTFGKIDASKAAAVAQVRVSEWELQRAKNTTRMDVRRAYFGLAVARDGIYLLREIRKQLANAKREAQTKLDNGDTSVDETDVKRLEFYEDQIDARGGDLTRNETVASAALRFMSGDDRFEIPDEPIKKPELPLAPLVRYLTAARLFRPEINMAKAGISARRALLALQRAKLFPNIGVGFSASYSTAPSAVMQNNAWIADPFNRYGFGIALGLDWRLDLLPQAARIAQAESQLEELNAQERMALGGIAMEVEQAFAGAKEAENREEVWGRAERRAKEWIVSVRSAIELGNKDEMFLAEPLRAYFDARSSHLQAIYDVVITRSELARVTGWDEVAPNTL